MASVCLIYIAQSRNVLVSIGNAVAFKNALFHLSVVWHVEAIWTQSLESQMWKTHLPIFSVIAWDQSDNEKVFFELSIIYCKVRAELERPRCALHIYSIHKKKVHVSRPVAQLYWYFMKYKNCTSSLLWHMNYDGLCGRRWLDWLAYM